MGNYTQRGSDILDKRIGSDLARIAEVVSPHCLAGVLLGGYGRGEGTPFILPDGTQAPFNDYDLVVITRSVGATVRMHFHELEQQLTREIGLPVDLCPYALSELPSREFSLLNYEMKHGHIVLWGSDDVLDALPNYPHNNIPLFEGSRLLLNRGKLLLDIKQRLTNPEPLTDKERIRFIKFIHKVWLAFGDCGLLAAGEYHISYATKKDRIGNVGAMPERDYIVEHYRKALALKEWGNYSALESFSVENELKRTSEAFLKILPWFRNHYSKNECSLMKAAALNLRWNGRPLFRHPRLYLYDAITELLKDAPDARMLTQFLFSTNNHIERFYLLQRRFS